MPLTWMFRGVLHWVLEILIGNYCEQHHFHLDKLSASSWGHSHSEVESRLDLPCVEGGYNKESYMTIILINSNKNIHDNLTWTVGAQKLSCRLKEKNIIIQFMIKNTTGFDLWDDNLTRPFVNLFAIQEMVKGQRWLR